MFNKIKRKLSDKLSSDVQLPLNQISGVMYFEIFDGTLLSCENCVNIEIYNENSVTLDFSGKKATVHGFDIEIPEFSPEGVFIHGNFTSIEFGE